MGAAFPGGVAEARKVGTGGGVCLGDEFGGVGFEGVEVALAFEPHDGGAEGGEEDEGEVACVPEEGLLFEGGDALDEEGVEEEAAHGADVAGGVEEVGVVGVFVVGEGEPALEDGGVGGDGEVGEAGDGEEEAKEPEGGIAVGHGVDELGVEGDGEGEEGEE